jgi:hypothetical protein
MYERVALKCRCGAVRGYFEHRPNHAELHSICYCTDCQAMAAFLGNGNILNDGGGTDIFQVAAARIKLTQGGETLRCARLSSHGVLRWYTDCCRTSVANVAGPGIPLVGLIHAFFDKEAIGRPLNGVLGEPVCCLFSTSATGPLPAGIPLSPPPGLIFRRIFTMLSWLSTGQAWPSPFFDRSTKQPISEPQVLNAPG